LGIVIGFVTGMRAEARLLRGRMVVVGAEHASALVGRADILVSFGVAGGLDPALRPGTLVVSDAGWAGRLGAVHGRVIGVDAPICTIAAKKRLQGAVVDMESHVVERVAHQASLGFVAVRAVLDPAERAVPEAALALWQGARWAPVGDWPALARLAVDYARAMRTLRRAARLMAREARDGEASRPPIEGRGDRFRSPR
jgi:adenosylhomocysteine nucleosidase